MKKVILFCLFCFSSQGLWGRELSQGLWQAHREDGTLFLLTIESGLKNAVLSNRKGKKLLEITPLKDGGYSFTDKGRELFTTEDSLDIPLDRPRYSLAPIPREGVLMHKGFVVSGQVFESIPFTSSASAVNLDKVRLRFFTVDTDEDGYWFEDYGFEGFSYYKALPYGTNLWAVEYGYNGGGSGVFSSVMIVEKKKSILRPLKVIAGGDRHLGGVSDLSLRGQRIEYLQNLVDIPSLWLGDYGAALEAIRIDTGYLYHLFLGHFGYDPEDTKPYTLSITLLQDLTTPSGEIIPEGKTFSSPGEFQAFLKKFLREAGAL